MSRVGVLRMRRGYSGGLRSGLAGRVVGRGVAKPAVGSPRWFGQEMHGRLWAPGTGSRGS